MKNVGKLVVLGAVLAVSASFAFADTITLGSYGTTSAPIVAGIGSTGINSALNYAGFCGTPTCTAPFNDAVPSGAEISSGVGTSYNVVKDPAWSGPLANSNWVGLKNSGGQDSGAGGYTPDNGYYTFTSTFNITTAGTYAFTLDLLADDTVAVFLNGANVVKAGAIGGDAKCSDTVPTCVGSGDVVNFSSVLASGSNKLTFVVEQTGKAAMGLDFNGLATNAAPEPNSLILLGSGLLSGAGMLMRKRRTV